MSVPPDFDDTGAFPLDAGLRHRRVSSPVRVAIADRYPIVLDGLEQVFLLEPALQITGRTSDRDQLTKLLADSRPDVLILDPAMLEDPVGDLIRLSASDTRIVVFTAELDEDETIAVIRAGVRGVVLKHMHSRVLAACVRRVAEGQLWIDRSSVARALEKIIRKEAQAQQVNDILSGREIDVLRLAAQGMRNREIAGRLEIGESAVKTHLHAVYEKLNIRTRDELADFARDRGLVIG